ncbi:MAG: hypothetical protein ACKOSQ_00465 [Planctomycetaceae bacterium]
MQNLVGTLLAIGILAGGFAITGDLGRLAARGMRVIGATDVPTVAPTPPRLAAAPAPSGVGPLPPPPVVAQPPRPAGGAERVELASARPGQRILVWIGSAEQPLAVDVVDPTAAAVILAGGGPRRVAVVGGAFARGEVLRVVGLGLAHAGGAAPESLGRITALDVGR